MKGAAKAELGGRKFLVATPETNGPNNLITHPLIYVNRKNNLQLTKLSFIKIIQTQMETDMYTMDDIYELRETIRIKRATGQPITSLILKQRKMMTEILREEQHIKRAICEPILSLILEQRTKMAKIIREEQRKQEGSIRW